MDWVKIIMVAVSSVGWLQWLKKPWGAVPSWVWWAAYPVLCVGLAAAAVYLPPFVMIAVVAMAIGTVGYDTIIKLIEKKIESMG